MLEFNILKLPYEACIILRCLCSEMGVLPSGARIVVICSHIVFIQIHFDAEMNSFAKNPVPERPYPEFSSFTIAQSH